MTAHTPYDHPINVCPRPSAACDIAALCETVGWDTLTAINDGHIEILRDNDVTVGFRFDLQDKWWVSCVHTGDDKFSVCRINSIVPFGWVHDVPLSGVADVLMRACVEDMWPPEGES